MLAPGADEVHKLVRTVAGLEKLGELRGLDLGSKVWALYGAADKKRKHSVSCGKVAGLRVYSVEPARVSGQQVSGGEVMEEHGLSEGAATRGC